MKVPRILSCRYLTWSQLYSQQHSFCNGKGWYLFRQYLHPDMPRNRTSRADINSGVGGGARITGSDWRMMRGGEQTERFNSQFHRLALFRNQYSLTNNFFHYRGTGTLHNGCVISPPSDLAIIYAIHSSMQPRWSSPCAIKFSVAQQRDWN